MAISNDELINTLKLTDCLYFTNGCCIFKNKCRYRHCQTAIKQLAKCLNWPDSCRNLECPYRHTGTTPKAPKPLPQAKELVSIFWDIENISIPKGQRPFDIVRRIRQKLVTEPGLQEADFSCYCNSNTISQENQQSLYQAAVRIVHVADKKSGAADRHIMLDLDRFERVHKPPATIVLISGDIDFVGKLSDLRHQARFHVIVIHNKPAKEELKAIVNEHYPWELFIEPLQQQQQQQLLQPVIRNNLGILPNQPTNIQPILNDRLNNENNINKTAAPKLKQPPLITLLDSPGENNLPQNDYTQSKSPALHRRLGNVTRNHRSMNHTQPPKPLMAQHVNQTPALNTGSDIPPSPTPPTIVPRTRKRQSRSTNRRARPNMPRSASCERIASTIDDDNTTKVQSKSLRCPYCTNEFSTIDALHQHQNDKKHLYDCPVCKKGFPTSYGLKQHQLAKGHNGTNDKDDQHNVQLGTADNLNTHQSATRFKHNLNVPNNTKRPPVYQNPLGGDSSTDDKK